MIQFHNTKRFIFAIYLFILLWLTLIDREWGTRRAILMPFWEYRELFTSGNTKYWLRQIGSNLIMLMPLGIMLPMLHKRWHSFKSVFLTTLATSVFIEVTQYITGRGLCEFDDVFNNTVGACTGFLIYRKIRRYLLPTEQ